MVTKPSLTQAIQNLGLEQDIIEFLVMEIPMGILITDLAGQAQFTNAKWETLTGLNPEQSLGDQWQKWFKEDVQNLWKMEKLDATDLTNNDGKQRLRIRRKKLGSEPRGFLFTIKDVTGEFQAEKKVKDLGHFLDAILNATEYSVISTKTDGTITFFNQGAEELLGYKAEEVVGIMNPGPFHLPEEVVARTSELQEELGASFEPGFETFVIKARKTKMADRKAWTYVRKDGCHVPVILSVTGIWDHNGDLNGYLGIAQNIENELAAQQEREYMVDLIRETGRLAKLGGWEFKLKDQSISWSPELYDVYEVSHDFEPTVDNIFGFFGPGFRQELENARDLAITTRQPKEIESELTTGLGKKIWVRTIIKSEYKDGVPYRMFGTTQDITDLKNAHEKIRDFQELFTRSSVPMAIANYEGYLENLNPAWTRVLGWSLEELMDEPFLSFVHPEDQEKTVEIFSQLLTNNGIVEGFINRYLHRDGSYRTLSWYGASVLAEEKIYSVAEDITELIRQEETLRKALEEAANFKMAMDQTGLVSMTDVKGNIIYCNDLFCQISEFKREELIGQNHRIIRSQVHSQSYFKDMWRTIAQGEIWVGEICNQAKSGKPYWVDATIVPIIGENGKPDRYLSFRTLIDQRKAMESEVKANQERLLAAQRMASIGHWEFDLKTKEIFRSPETDRILELHGHQNPVRAFWQRVHPEDRMPLRRMISNVMDEAIRIETEVRFVFDDWSEKTLALVVEPVLNEAGDVVKITGTNQDITERKRMEKDLILAKEQAEAATRAKSGFLSMMSHEIRTPMNAVIGMAHLLRDENPQPHQVQHIETLQFSAENLLSLINDILDFSKIEAGKVDLEKVTINMKEVMQRALKVFEFRAQSKGLELREAFDESLPAFVQGDVVRITQVLNNLIGNALKFTEKGYVELGAKPLDSESGQARMEIWVSDSGIGIPEEKIGSIFQSFTQASSDTTRKHGGTGLGLTITRLLLELMDSTIQVESQQGRGTRFFFELSLPLAQAEQFESRKLPSTQKQPLGIKVLLAEDNQVNVMVATRFLSKWEVNVDRAKDGLEAVSLATENHYDLILMDIQMPNMDGFEATRLIRQENQNIPIIALTAEAFSEGRSQANEVGMTDYVTKPFNPNDLYDKIRRYC